MNQSSPRFSMGWARGIGLALTTRHVEVSLQRSTTHPMVPCPTLLPLRAARRALRGCRAWPWPFARRSPEFAMAGLVASLLKSASRLVNCLRCRRPACLRSGPTLPGACAIRAGASSRSQSTSDVADDRSTDTSGEPPDSDRPATESQLLLVFIAFMQGPPPDETKGPDFQSLQAAAARGDAARRRGLVSEGTNAIGRLLVGADPVAFITCGWSHSGRPLLLGRLCVLHLGPVSMTDSVRTPMPSTI
jgi:hypothetical protein